MLTCKILLVSQDLSPILDTPYKIQQCNRQMAYPRVVVKTACYDGNRFIRKAIGSTRAGKIGDYGTKCDRWPTKRLLFERIC